MHIRYIKNILRNWYNKFEIKRISDLEIESVILIEEEDDNKAYLMKDQYIFKIKICYYIRTLSDYLLNVLLFFIWHTY